MDLSRNVETSVKRLDVAVLVGGILFSFAVLALTWWAGPRLNAVELLPDQGASWYYWKLRSQLSGAVLQSEGFILHTRSFSGG
jgi:hypothetical protein